MRYKYRGQFNNGQMTDIFDFDGRIAKCDHNHGDVDIDEFNSIIVPRETFKDILNLEDSTVISEEHKQPKKRRNQNDVSH